MCYASIGHVLGIDCDKFFQWVFSKIPSAPNDQLRVFYLRTIAEAVKLDVTSQVFYDAMVMIMAYLQDVLENADSPELLLVLLDVLKIIARDYPHIFAEYFRDTVDILVGWHIDTSQNDALTQKTADCLVSFHPYWVSDMRFSLTLLGQFLEDMEAYAEELDSINHGKVEKEEVAGPFTALPKLTALTKVFTTVVSGLGEFFSPGREAKITSGYISDTVERIIKCVDICGFGLQFEKLLIAANKCLTVLVTSLGHAISVSCLKLIKFVNGQLDSKKNVTYHLLKSSLHLMDKAVATVGASLPVDVIPELLQVEKPLMRYRSIADPEVLAIVMRVFQSLLSIKNMPLLEKIYKYVITDIQFHYAVLQQASKGTEEEKDAAINENNSYPLAVFNISVLAEIATYKSTISGAWKVEPSTFNLLTKLLDPTNKEMAISFPGVQYAILTTLYTHSQRCNNFVPGTKTKSSGNCNDSIHLIRVLCAILADLSSTTNAKCLCANWLCEITNSIASLSMDLQKRQWDLLPIVETFIKSVHFLDKTVKKEIADCTTKLTQSNLIHTVPLGRLLAEFMMQLTDIDENIRQKFQKVILSFPADIIASLPTVFHQIFKAPSVPGFLSNSKDVWLLCKRHMCRTPTGTLRSHGFKIIMNYLLEMKKEDRLEGLSWMEPLYSSAQRLGKIVDPVSGDLNMVQFLPKSIDGAFPINGNDNGFLLCFWVCWMAAEFCVLSRLKTPLGKASDTFQTIEASIKEMEARFRESSSSSKKNMKNDGTQVSEDCSKYLVIHQAVLLLQFLEDLEKLMYNAYEGTATSLPQYMRPVRTFFRTNRNTCCEWLNRIQESTTKLANLCGSPEKAIRNGFRWLQRLKNTGNTHGSEFENAVVTVVDSLIQLHCDQGVKGILDWARKEVGRDFYWLHAAIPKANGGLENAALQLKTGLHSYLSPDRLKTENLNEPKKTTVTVLTKDPVINADSNSIQFLVRQITDCYLQLCDWNEVQEWNKQIKGLQSKFPSVQGLSLAIDHSYVKAMMKFEEHDFAGVHEQLEQIPGSTMGNMMQEQFPVLGAVKEEKDNRVVKTTQSAAGSKEDLLADKLTPHALLCKSRIFLMQALTLYWTSGLNTLKGSRIGSLHSSSWENVDKLLSQAHDTAFIPLQGLLLNGSAQSKAPFLMQLKSIAAIRETLMVADEDVDPNAMLFNVYGRTHYIDAQKTDISILNESLRTASYLQFHHTLHKKGWVAPTTNLNHKVPNIQTLQVMTAKLARKQGNKKLAESLLAKQLSLLESKGTIDGKMYLSGGAQLRLKQLSASVNSGKVVEPLAAVDILKESSKLKIALGHTTEAIDVLCSSILLSERQVISSSSKSNNNNIRLSEVSARSFVTLAKWILTDTKAQSPMNELDDLFVISNKVREVIKITTRLATNKWIQGLASTTSLSEVDITCGQLLQHSTYRCPQLGKTWFAYADWCYKWGRKIIEQENTGASVSLIDEEVDGIQCILPEGLPTTLKERVVNVISKAHNIKDISVESNTQKLLEEQPADEVNIRCHLHMLCRDYANDFKDYDESIDGLVKVWQAVISRVFAHYKHATISYFTYLKLNGSEAPTPTAMLQRSEYGNITSTLRLLRLMVKYSDELKQHLEEPFNETPTKPWKGIIPQLFARLNHPDKYVQTKVANLLCRIAKDSPQLIVYPTVVGCSDMTSQQHLSKSSAQGILRAYQFNADDECEQPLSGNEPDSVSQEIVSQTDIDGIASSQEDLPVSSEEKIMLSSLHIILDTLNEDTPKLVQEVKCVVQELRRITLLWDELWLGSLTQLNQESQRRTNQLQTEIYRVNSNQTLSEQQKTNLIKEKHQALMRPLIFSLERLQKITSQPPETPHEKTFQSTYSKQIDKGISTLKYPSNPSRPDLSWEQSKKLYQTLQSQSQRRPISNLNMAEVSPILSSSKFELIPLPGIECSNEQMISLKCFAQEIHILPTKTKPKKLIMLGHDNQRYPYLFKGLEDLHLDERIMQFLEICNHMFAKTDRSGEKAFVARHYSVTPLGPRSGLIQWVDGATPLFSLYRRWQNREAASVTLLKTQGDKQTAQPPTIMRPTDLFFNKINPLFKEKGIDIQSSRKEWPLPLLRKTLAELSNDTPCDLLSREFWTSSINAANWWKIIQTYTHSVAVMSIIGYIIGLGDRHLDNILVDLTSGEVVHIDYNVCFEKGKLLRVPERVPFRMTQNMQDALGVTGVEGVFRASCEAIMTTLRQGRETLLTLLEAFVYDPLVDWTTANDGAFAGAFYGGGAGLDDGNKYSRKEIERGITRTLLSTRVAEMQVSWTANKDDLTHSLKNLRISFEGYCKAVNSQYYTQEELHVLKHQMTLLKSALLRSDHPLHTLQSRYDKQARLLEDFKFWKHKLDEKLIESKHLLLNYQKTFLKVQGSHIASLFTEVCKLAEVGSPSYGPAVSFLKSAGQSNVVKQCESIENELSVVLNQRRSALRNCLEAVLTYSSIVNQFSLEYTNHPSLCLWVPLLSNLLMDPTSVNCNETLAQSTAILEAKAALHKDFEPLVVTLENKLDHYFNEQNGKLGKLCERRNTEPTELSGLSGPVTETWNALRKFVGDAGGAGAISLACVTVTALNTLNKRQLVMENAAAVATERLMHLTSRDGDWFLDELSTMCANISQLLSVLKNNPLRPQLNAKNNQNQSSDLLDNINVGMQVVFAAVKTYTSLQELMSNFRTIIVPEAANSFLKNNQSVIYIAETVKDLVENSPMTLKELCEAHEKAIKTKTDVSEEVQETTNKLKQIIDRLILPEVEDREHETNGGSPMMNAGQMLLEGFTGLFKKAEDELSVLYDYFRRLKSHDVSTANEQDNQQEKNIKLSKSMCSAPNSKWQNYFFVKKLVSIHGFFEACLQQSNATREIDMTVKDLNAPTLSEMKNSLTPFSSIMCVFNEDLLSLSVKQFIADCVQSFLIGVPSCGVSTLLTNYVSLLAPSVARENKKGVVSIENLCTKLVDTNLKSNSFNHHHLSQASGLINAHDVAWRKHDLARRLDGSITAQKEIVQRAQRQLVRFQWLHGDICSGIVKKRNQSLSNPTKASVVSEIKKKMHAINQVEQSIPALMEKYTQLQSSIEQRLKWASGANPALNSVMENFDQAVSEKKATLMSESSLTPEVIGLASAIVQFETFRMNTSEVANFDQTIVTILEKCGKSSEVFESCMGDWGDVEQLMNSLQISVPPSEPITVDWMKNRLGIVENKSKSIQNSESSVKGIIQVEKDSLKGQVSTVKSCFTAHHALVGEVKTMLKTLAKDEEAPECTNVRRFIQSHNKCSEDSSIVLKKILAVCSVNRTEPHEDLPPFINDDDSSNVINLIDDLDTSVSTLHNHLLDFGVSSMATEETTTTVGGQFSSSTTALLSSPSTGSTATTGGGATASTQEKQTEEYVSFATALQKQSFPSEPTPTSAAPSGVVSSLPEAQGDGGGRPNQLESVASGAVRTPVSAIPLVASTSSRTTVATTPKKSMPSFTRDPKTGKALQEKNLYALNVWKRVKAKLEGRELDVNTRSSVVDQVGRVIDDAISLDNLCQLYEGWTPWV
ncbi:serine/threonine-protein kinase SMG1-like [Clytia hemisphaerica]|uniref:non-specific serine/threonine protein kinase n=1 Tax=Clytia hemisphaerica TaxID=252671 RepID=A0A7M5WQX1_9CNID